MNPKEPNKGPKIVISGYYGFDNCGDEAVLSSMIRSFRQLKPDIRITVLSGNPESTTQEHGVNAVNRWNPLTAAREILSCRLLISGGGSLLQDVTSTKNVLYYLAVIRLATLFNKKVMIYSQGIGPLNNAKNRIRVSKAFNRCNVITVRDELSSKLLKEIGINRDIQVTCDPVMALTSEDADKSIVRGMINYAFRAGNEADNHKPLLMVAIRRWSDDRHLAPVAAFLDIQARLGWRVLLVPAHYPDDSVAQSEISALMTESKYCLDKGLTARQFFAATAIADKVFSMRLHGLICAFAVGTPMLALSYDPKVGAFMQQAGFRDYCLSFESFDPETAAVLSAKLDNLSAESIQTQDIRRRELMELAWNTAKKAIELLEL